MNVQAKYGRRYGSSIQACAARPRMGVLPGWLEILCIAILCGLGSLSAFAAPAANGSKPAFAAGHILVAKNPASLDVDFLAAVGAQQGKSLGRLKGLEVHVVDVPPGNEQAMVARLARNPHIKFAELDTLVEPSATPSDPGYPSEWHLPKINGPAAWDISVGSGVTIAILDTGVDGTHPDLAPRLVPGWNFYDNNGNTSDVYGHGTSVAGVAAAAMNNGIGVAGVAGNANIMPVRISDPSGYALWSTVAQGLTWAADNGARVANISYAVAGSNTVISAANYFRSKGGVVAVSAGNTSAAASTSPTSSMLVVAATDANDLRASFSTYGSFVSIAAPGVSIYTTAKGGGYRYASGTSFSSPIIAGSAALILSLRPDYTPAQVDAVLKTTATDLGSPGADIYFGAGRVDAAAAVQQAESSGSGDSVPPSVAITSPTGGSAAGTVSVSVSASDNVGVTRVELRVNGITVATDTSAPFQFAWNSASIADGTVALAAVAYDAAGNSAISAAVSVTVANGSSTADTTPPSVAIASPSGSTASVSGTVAVSINASDNVGVTRVELRVNGSIVASGNTSPFQFAWNSATVPDGSATLTATAYDAAGNSAVSPAVNVDVANNATDTTAPELSITSPSNGATLKGNITISTSVSDDNGAEGIVQRLYIDGVLKATVTGKSSMSTKWNTRTAAAGSHTIAVTATDAAGNSTTQQIQVITIGK